MGRLTRSLALLAVLACAASARADECGVTWSAVGEDFEEMLEAPFGMDRDAAYLTLGATALTGASVLWWDDDVDRWVQRRPDSFAYGSFHALSRVADWYGANNTNAIITYAAAIGAVALGGVIADDDYVLDTAAVMAEAGAFSFLLNVAAKTIVARARPHTGKGPYAFGFLTSPTDSDMHSFLSGHTANAFALAAAAAGRHPHWYVEVPGYLFATAAGLQRVDSRSHWISDVVSGALFGYAVGEFVADRHRCGDAGGSGASGPTLALTFRF